MKEESYKPYLELVQQLPRYVDHSSESLHLMLEHIASNRGIELGEMTPKQTLDLWDEFAASVYGSAINADTIPPQIYEAFQDFDAFMAEMDQIHHQFQRRPRGQGQGQRQVEMLPMVEQPATRQIETLPMAQPQTNENGLVAYTSREQENLSSGKRNFILRTVSELKQFISKALTQKNNTDRAYMGKIPDSVVEQVKAATGIDVSGFSFMVNGDDIRHIFNSHGDERKESARGQIAVTPDNLSLLPEVLANPDRVYLSDKLDRKGRPAIYFEKHVGNLYITVQGVSNGRQLLQTDSVYIRKKKEPASARLNTGNTSPEKNVQNEVPQGSFGSSLPQSSTPVNPATAQQEASPDTQQGDTIGIQFHSEPANMTEGGWAIETTRLNRMVERATAEVNQALSQRTMTRADVEQTVSAMLSKEFGMTKANADSLAARFGAQYQAIIDQGSARLYQEMQEGDGPRQASQANNTWQNATQMTPEEREMAGMEPGGEEYTTRSEAYSNDQARSLIDRLGWDGAYQYLMQNDTWNPADVKAAVEVGRHLLSQARSETDPKAKEALYEQAGQIGMRYQQDRSAAGRSLQASAQYASDPVLEAVGQLEKLLKESKVGQKMSEEERAAAIADAAKRGQELQDVLSAENNVDDLVSYIERYAKDRGITKTVVRGNVKDVARYIHGNLSNMTSEMLSTLARESLDDYISIKYGNPASVGQRLKTILVLNHLFRPITWMRNVVGNFAFAGIDSASNGLATAMDVLMSKRTGTRSTVTGSNFFSKEARSAKWQAFNQSVAAVYLGLNLDGGTNRYGQTGTRTFRMNSETKSAVLTRTLSKLERNLSYALTSSDQFFKGGVQATQQARIQQLLDSGQIDPERLGVDVTPEKYAAWRGKELAKYRTFQDDSTMSILSQGIHDLFNIAGIGDTGERFYKGRGKIKAFGLGDAIITYPKVPGNIASRVLEYSPAGLAKGIIDISRVLKSGSKATVQAQHKAVSELARGITGAALIGIAAVAAANGIIRSTDDDDNLDEKTLNRAEGVNSLQVNLSALLRFWAEDGAEWRQGDRLVTIDFLQPVNSWLALGCFINSYFMDGERDEAYDGLTASMNAMANSMESFPALSLLQNISDNLKYSGDGKNAIVATAEEVRQGLSSSVVPSFIRSIATAADPYQRVTTSGQYGAVSFYDFINQKTGIKAEWLKALAEFFDGTLKIGETADTIVSSIPILRQTLPMKLDNYGQPMGYTGSRPLDVANALLLPGSVYSYNQRELTKVLSEVSAYTGTINFYPNRNPATYVEYGGTKHEMTFDQQQEYQKTYGTVYYDMANELIQSQVWQDADPMTRADMLSKIEEIASAQARVNFMDSIGQDYSGSDSANLIAKLDDMAAGGVDFATYYDWKNRLSAFSGDEKQADILSALASSGLSEQQQRTLYYGVGGYSISEEKLAQGATVGLNEDDLKVWRYRFDQASNVDGWTAQQISDNLIQPSADLSADQKHVLGDMFLTEYIPIEQAWDVDYSSPDAYILSQLPDSAQDRYEAIVQNYLTPQQWSDIYNRYSGYKRKDQKIAAMMADGYSESDAKKLYDWMSKDIDDSYYVGKMSDAALYYWQNGLGAEDIMSPKQWLTLTEEYAGVDYQTALDAMRKAGYTEYYASIFAKWLSQM